MSYHHLKKQFQNLDPSTPEDPRLIYISNCCNGSTYFENATVKEDVDAVLRYYTPKSDELGRIRFADFKTGSKGMYQPFGKAQEMTFGLIDKMLRTSNYADRYLGFDRIWSNLPDFEKSDRFSINMKEFTRNEFNQYLRNEIQPPEYKFRIY